MRNALVFALYVVSSVWLAVTLAIALSGCSASVSTRSIVEAVESLPPNPCRAIGSAGSAAWVRCDDGRRVCYIASRPSSVDMECFPSECP